MTQCELEQSAVESAPPSVDIPIEIEIEIEEEALATRPAGAASIAVTVGLDGATAHACAVAMGDAVHLVAAQEVLGAGDLVAVLRPRIVVVTARLEDADGTHLTRTAASLGIPLVCVGSDATVEDIATLIRRVRRAASGEPQLGEPGPPSAPGPRVTEIALAIGLDAEMLEVCAGALGEAIELVVAPGDADVSALLPSLRPRLVLVASCLTNAESSRLDAAAASCDAPVVCVGTGVSAAAMTWLVQRAAATELGVAPVVRRRAHRTPLDEVLP